MSPTYVPAVRNRNGSSQGTAAGRGFGMDSRFAYENTSTPTILHVDTRASGSSNTDATHGSLQWCLTRGFARIITFDVGGRFDIGSGFNITDDDVWLAGQTAPSQVMIVLSTSDGDLRVRCNNFFAQHIIFWHEAKSLNPGYDGNNNDNALILSGGGTTHSNVVLDHCFFGGGTDQVLGIFSDMEYITIIDSIIGCPRGKNPDENVDPDPDGPNPYDYDGVNGHQFNCSIAGNSFSEDSNFVSIIGTLFEDGSIRNPNCKAQTCAMVNTMVYNRGTEGCTLRGKSEQDQDNRINCVGVWDRRGTDTSLTFQTNAVLIGRSNGALSFGTGTQMYVDDCVATTYVNGESGSDLAVVTDEWDMVDDPDNQESTIRVDTLVASAWPEGLVAASMRDLSIADRASLMTDNIGPRPSSRITYITDIINDAKNATGSLQVDYTTPTVSNVDSPAYSEPGTPHSAGTDSNRTIIEEDLLDKAEAFLV